MVVESSGEMALLKASQIYQGAHRLLSENPLGSSCSKLAIALDAQIFDEQAELIGIQELLWEVAGLDCLTIQCSSDFVFPDDWIQQLLNFIVDQHIDTLIVIQPSSLDTQGLFDSAYLLAFSHLYQGAIRKRKSLGSFHGKGSRAKPRRSLLRQATHANLALGHDQQEQQQVVINHSYETEGYLKNSFTRWDLDKHAVKNYTHFRTYRVNLILSQDKVDKGGEVKLGQVWGRLFTEDTYRPAVDRIHVSALEYICKHFYKFTQGFFLSPMPEGFRIIEVNGQRILCRDGVDENIRKPIIPWSFQIYQCVRSRTKWCPPTASTFDAMIHDGLIPEKYKAVAMLVFSGEASLLGEFYQTYGSEKTMALLQAFNPHADDVRAKTIFNGLPRLMRYYRQFGSPAAIDALLQIISDPQYKRDTFIFSLVYNEASPARFDLVLDAYQRFLNKMQDLGVNFPFHKVSVFRLTNVSVLLAQLSFVIECVSSQERQFVLEQGFLHPGSHVSRRLYPLTIDPIVVKQYYWACYQYGYKLVLPEMKLRFERSSDNSNNPYQPTVRDFFQLNRARLDASLTLFLRWLAIHPHRLPICYIQKALANVNGEYNRKLDQLYADVWLGFRTGSRSSGLMSRSEIDEMLMLGILAAVIERGNIDSDLVLVMSDLKGSISYAMPTCAYHVKEDKMFEIYQTFFDQVFQRMGSCSDLSINKAISILRADRARSNLYSVSHMAQDNVGLIGEGRTRFYNHIVYMAYSALRGEDLVPFVSTSRRGDNSTWRFDSCQVDEMVKAIRTVFDGSRLSLSDRMNVSKLAKRVAIRNLWQRVCKQKVVDDLYHTECMRNQFPAEVEKPFSNHLKALIDQSNDAVSAIDVIDEAFSLHATFVYLNQVDSSQFVRLFNLWHKHRNRIESRDAKDLLFILGRTGVHALSLYNDLMSDRDVHYRSLINHMKKYAELLNMMRSYDLLSAIIDKMKRNQTSVLDMIVHVRKEARNIDLSQDIQDELSRSIMFSHDGEQSQVFSHVNTFVALLSQGIRDGGVENQHRFVHGMCALLMISEQLGGAKNGVWEQIHSSDDLDKKICLVVLLDQVVFADQTDGFKVDLITKLVARLWALDFGVLKGLSQVFDGQEPPRPDALHAFLDQHPYGDGLVDRLASDPLLTFVDSGCREQFYEADHFDRLLKRVYGYDSDGLLLSDRIQLGNDFRFVNAIGYEYKFPYAGADAAYKSLDELSAPDLKALLTTLKADFHETNQLIYIAVMREAMYRMTGKMPYASQLLAVLLSRLDVGKNILLRVACGEGKGIIVALLAAFEWAFGGKTITVSTANMLLAKRDQSEFSRFFDFIGIQSTCLSATSDYAEFCMGGVNYTDMPGYSLFKARMACEGRSLVSDGGQYYSPCIIGDEIDDALLDDKIRYNLSLPHDQREGQQDYKWLYVHVNNFVSSVLPTIRDEHEQVHITQCRDYLRSSATLPWQLSQLDNFEDSQFIGDDQINIWIDTAIEVHKLVLGNDYVIQRGRASSRHQHLMVYLRIRDKINTSARISHGGHQLLTAHLQSLKGAGRLPNHPSSDPDFMMEPESHFISSENSKNVVDFHLASGGRILGITGTPGSQSERNELRVHYGFKFYKLPTYRPYRGRHMKDKFAFSFDAQLDLILSEINHLSGRPVIIFAKDAVTAERMHRGLLAKHHFRGRTTIHLVNADQGIDVSLYGKANMVTIATPILGRGTDVRPTHVHGLHVIETFVASFRESEQMRRRCARNGAEGSFQMILNVKDLSNDYGVKLPAHGCFDATHYGASETRLKIIDLISGIRKRVDEERAIERRYLQKTGDKKAGLMKIFESIMRFNLKHGNFSDTIQMKSRIDKAKMALVRDLELMWMALLSESDPNGDLSNPYIQYDFKSASYNTDKLDDLFYQFCVKSENYLFQLLETSFEGYKFPTEAEHDGEAQGMVGGAPAFRAPSLVSQVQMASDAYLARFNVHSETNHAYEQRVLFKNQLENDVFSKGFLPQATSRFQKYLASLTIAYLKKLNLKVDDLDIQSIKKQFVEDLLRNYSCKNRYFCFVDFYHHVMKPLKLGLRDLDLGVVKEALCKELTRYCQNAFWVGSDRKMQIKQLVKDNGDLTVAKSLDEVVTILRQHGCQSLEIDKGLWRRDEAKESRFRRIITNFLAVADPDKLANGLRSHSMFHRMLDQDGHVVTAMRQGCP